MVSVFEYDIYVPLFLNDGTSISKDILEEIKSVLAEEFGGVTDFRHRNEGIWKVGDIVYRDEILILRTLSSSAEKARKFMKNLKNNMMEKLVQEDVLIVERTVSRL
jgi:hypothetical protein